MTRLYPTPFQVTNFCLACLISVAAAADLSLLKPLNNLPISAALALKAVPVLDVATGSVRYLPQLPAHQKYPARDTDIVWMGDIQRSDELPPEQVCECALLLAESEFIVSEVPIRNEAGRYVSINDESYKAILELLDYPLVNHALTTVAFSELAYVYNADAIRLFLEARGFSILTHSGFMNSPDYPGYRDTQYFVARPNKQPDEAFIVVRGTSGTDDIEVSLDARMVPWWNTGLVHRGYEDLAQHILGEIDALIPSASRWIITGHSLGGSVSLLLAEHLAAREVDATAFTYAPIPVFDRTAANKSSPARITNSFLPNEETLLEGKFNSEKWGFLKGEMVLLTEVGTTAGAAHYVINYLKSRWVESGRSRQSFEDALPLCVVEKFPCFRGNTIHLLPACIYGNKSYEDKSYEDKRYGDKSYGDERYSKKNCLRDNFPLIAGMSDSMLNNSAAIAEVVLSTQRSLLNDKLSTKAQRYLWLRLAVGYQLQGEDEKATNLFNFLDHSALQGRTLEHIEALRSSSH